MDAVVGAPPAPQCQGVLVLSVSWGGGMQAGGSGVTVVPDGFVPCREKWCHMTQEERDDSLRFNENITFGQLG